MYKNIDLYKKRRRKKKKYPKIRIYSFTIEVKFKNY